MKRWIIIVNLFTVSFSLSGNESVSNKEIIMEKTQQYHQYLYKILSLRNWEASQSRKTVQLSADDDAFIHLATEDQLEKIIEKYWADAPQLVILKIDSNKLEGKLVLESNPRGSTKYYHLYNGFIPFNSILESKVVFNSP